MNTLHRLFFRSLESNLYLLGHDLILLSLCHARRTKNHALEVMKNYTAGYVKYTRLLHAVTSIENRMYCVCVCAHAVFLTRITGYLDVNVYNKQHDCQASFVCNAI